MGKHEQSRLGRRLFKEALVSSIKRLRLSYLELSRRTGIPYDSIYQYAHGGCTPPMRRAEAIARVLDFDLADVYCGSERQEVHIFPRGELQHSDTADCSCSPTVEATRAQNIYTHKRLSA